MNTDQHAIPVAVGKPDANLPEPQVGTVAERAPEAVACFTPLIDIHEGPEGLILEADLPGASQGHVSIQLEQNVLTLHARIVPPVPDGARALYEEFRIGDFYRSFILSDEVERNGITAELRNGVLRLVLPKAERAKTRRIEIKS